jgi:hypothetical protein
VIVLLNKKELCIKLVVKSLFYTMMHGRKSIKLFGEIFRIWRSELTSAMFLNMPMTVQHSLRVGGIEALCFGI